MGKRVLLATGLAGMATAVALLGGPVASAQGAAPAGVNAQQGTVEVNAECSYVVTAVKLSVRDAPAGRVIGHYFKDDVVRGEFGSNVNGYKFVTKRGSSLKGWVNASYLKPIGSCP